MQKLLQAERSTDFLFVVSGIDLEHSGPRLRLGTVNSDESVASTSLGRRLRPPSVVEVLIIWEVLGPRAKPRGHRTYAPGLTPNPSPEERGAGQEWLIEAHLQPKKSSALPVLSTL